MDNLGHRTFKSTSKTVHRNQDGGMWVRSPRSHYISAGRMSPSAGSPAVLKLLKL